VELDGLVALFAVAALTVGLAMQQTLANGAAGSLLLTLRPYRQGELVEAGGERGHVVETGLFATTLKTTEGILVTVPNRLVLDRPIRNLSRVQK
jgi:small conductance mechanosensitive channel